MKLLDEESETRNLGLRDKESEVHPSSAQNEFVTKIEGREDERQRSPILRISI